MTCPCGSGRNFDQCCGPILAGERAPATAEALMRARYSAYVRQQTDFIHESTLPRMRAELDPAATDAWSRQAEWRGLEILHTEGGGARDEDGVVEFVARYSMQGQDVDHHEIATFEKQDGKWFFVDGQEPKQVPFRRAEPKVGPNDPCPCGSGKKWKKCCKASA